MIPRRVLGSVIVLCLLAVAACEAADTAAPADVRPNVLLVMADDMGFTDLGSFGSEIHTPRLDELAARGVMFTDFHVSVACSITRSMLMSGNDNHVAGMGTMGELLADNQRGQPGYEGHINDRVVTLAEVLRHDGYHTYMAGKWHLGHEAGSLPFDRGFESALSLLGGGASHWADRLGIIPADDPAGYALNDEHLEELPADFYSSRSYADYLIDAIRGNHGDGRPFLGYLAFTAPHDPMHVPEPWLSKYRGWYDDGYEALKERRWQRAIELGVIAEGAVRPDRHPMVRGWDELSEPERATEARGMEVYAGMVDALDYHYGRVIDFLADIGELDNTIVLFLSDNGANPYYSNEYPGALEPDFANQFDNSVEAIGHPRSNYAYGIGFANASGGPLDKFKMTVGEGGIRAPLLMAGPGIEGGRQVDAFAYVWDILPTLLDFTGSEYPTEFEGRDVVPLRGRSITGLLDGSTSSAYGDNEFVGGEMGGGKWMRRGAYKAVLVPPPYGDGAWHLFNVVEDPGETADLSAEMPDLLAELQAAWDAYAADVGVIPPE